MTTIGNDIRRFVAGLRMQDLSAPKEIWLDNRTFDTFVVELDPGGPMRTLDYVVFIGIKIGRGGE